MDLGGQKSVGRKREIKTVMDNDEIIQMKRHAACHRIKITCECMGEGCVLAVICNAYIDEYPFTRTKRRKLIALNINNTHHTYDDMVGKILYRL